MRSIEPTPLLSAKSMAQSVMTVDCERLKKKLFAEKFQQIKHSIKFVGFFHYMYFILEE